MQVQTLSQEDPLEKEMTTHSSILAWEIPQAEEPGELQSMGLQRVRHDLVTGDGGLVAKSCLTQTLHFLRCRWILYFWATRDSSVTKQKQQQ